HALPWGLVAGELVQLFWWGAWLHWTGVRIRPDLRLDPAVRQVGRDLAPILGGEVLVALNLVVDKAFAGTLESGSVATLEYADRARVIPQTLLESTLVMVAYATWSNLRASGRLHEARRAVDQALRWTLALSVAPVAGMFIGRFVLVSLLYERGAFTPADTAATAGVLAWYLPGVVPNLLGILAVRAHVVERNLRLVFALGAASLLANAAFNAVLIQPMGLEGLALATTLNMVLVPGVYLAFLRRHLDSRAREWAVVLGVAAAAASIALFVELGPGAPTSLRDPVLWSSAVACLALLGLAWRVTRPTSERPDA
ncbi:MAG: lipid II flippase MurJ, partial [Myxococcota bacterium]|nr:lipid II flippase MurJ [Myxococcota bacterium]